MRTSKTKPVLQLLEAPAVFCLTHPRMNLEHYARESGQSLRAIQHQANEGKFILAEGQRGKYREINMVAEFLRDYEHALRELAKMR
ncbi:hypothetical protein GI383_24975 [Salmonella enterica]|nr:hypothetical protein [Salmonella enterica]